MSELKHVKLDYLNEKEIIEFYELFFGNILIKRPGFSYYSNLSKCLTKDNVVQSILEKLNSHELNILKILSRNIYIPNDYLIEKLHIIMDIPAPIIKKSISNLIEKKYIFIREDKKLVIPNVFFSDDSEKSDYKEDQDDPVVYSSRALNDINNLLNYYISKEIKHSNSFSLYKKDHHDLIAVFSNYSSINEDEYDLVTYFYGVNFVDETESLIIEKVKDYFNLPNFNKTMQFVKIVFPWLNTIISYFYKQNTCIRIKKDKLKNLWVNSILLTEYKNIPIKFSFEKTLKFLLKLNLIIKEKDEFIFPIFKNKEDDEFNSQARLTSSFNFFINADNLRKDFYFPAMFSDFIKYNKIVEYEITEYSVKRGVINGLVLDDVLDFFNSFSLKIPLNVETTLKQWFDKYASYFYSTGTHFFCQSREKGRLINSLVEKGLIKAYQIKENEVFLIPDEHKEQFFSFIEKSGIDFYQKKPIKVINEPIDKVFNINFLLTKIE
ncbi:MAG: hypothetical protein JXB50_01265 [Spirochaetes bacterium]|nr:hypothetical protein [Spirochaetota bacterium]